MSVFSKYFVDPIKNHYVDFGGRATRTQYWAFVGLSFLVSLAIMVAAAILGRIAGALGVITMALDYVLGLAILLPSIAIAARRLRDGGFSPWLLLLAFVPGIGGLILIILFLMPSNN